jgi:AcrR family transcriptional regulator
MTADRIRRRGRRPGESGSRESILTAGRELFAKLGYSAASLRAIAACAGVDAALIAHFFGDKSALFEEASCPTAQIPAALLEALAQSADGRPDSGAGLAMAYLAYWENPATASSLLAVAKSAPSHQGAMERLRTVLSPSDLDRARPFVAPDSVEIRLALAMSHLHGIAVARHVIEVPALATPTLEELVSAVAPAIQHYLTGTLTRVDGPGHALQ